MKDKIDRLTKYIQKHDYIYHGLGTSEISDAAYDKAFRTLCLLEEKYPEYKHSDSPIDRIGALPPDSNTCVHLHKMYSMSNVYDAKALQKWIESLDLPVEAQLYANLKADGLAIKLLYKEGKLIQGCTRGDGSVGEDVTRHTMRIHNIPKVTHNLTEYEVYGEVIIMPEDFNRLNALRAACNKQLYATPRNAVAGIMNLKSSKAVIGLRFMAYGSTLSDYVNHSDMIDDLAKSYSFEILDYVIAKRTELDKIDMFYYRYNKNMDIDHKLPHQDIPGDGVVVKVDDMSLQSQLGYTAKSPRFCRAWKFIDVAKTTQILSIRNQVGRTGVITPIANLAPVYIDGVQITSANLYNDASIIANQYFVGSMVEVVRSGGVIPKIVSRVMSTAATVPWIPQIYCPACDAKLIVKSCVTKYCINPACVGILHARLLYFVGRKGLNLHGFGEALLSKAIDAGYIHDLGDLLQLTLQQLVSLVGDTTAKKLHKRLTKARESLSFIKVLRAIAIAGLTDADMLKWIELVTDHNSELDSLDMLISTGLSIDALRPVIKSSKSIEAIGSYLRCGGEQELKKIIYTKV